jgi:hypothetical protein
LADGQIGAVRAENTSVGVIGIGILNAQVFRTADLAVGTLPVTGAFVDAFAGRRTGAVGAALGARLTVALGVATHRVFLRHAAVTLWIADKSVGTFFISAASRDTDFGSRAVVFADQAGAAIIVVVAFVFRLLAWTTIAFGQTTFALGAIAVELAHLGANAFICAKLVGSASLFARRIVNLPTVTGIRIARIAA